MKEATQLLHRTRRTLYRWAKIGYGPKPHKDGMFIFYFEDDINEFLISQVK